MHDEDGGEADVGEEAGGIEEDDEEGAESAADDDVDVDVDEVVLVIGSPTPDH